MLRRLRLLPQLRPCWRLCPCRPTVAILSRRRGSRHDHGLHSEGGYGLFPVPPSLQWQHATIGRVTGVDLEYQRDMRRQLAEARLARQPFLPEELIKLQTQFRAIDVTPLAKECCSWVAAMQFAAHRFVGKEVNDAACAEEKLSRRPPAAGFDARASCSCRQQPPCVSGNAQAVRATASGQPVCDCQRSPDDPTDAEKGLSNL